MTWPTRVWAVAEVLSAANMVAFISDPMDEIDALLDLSTPTVHTAGGILLGGGAGAAFTVMSILADGEIVVGDGVAAPVALAAFSSSTGQLLAARGGTGFDSSGVVLGDLIKGSGAGTMALLTKGTGLQLLRVNAGATDLEYATVGVVDDLTPQLGGNLDAQDKVITFEEIQHAAPGSTETIDWSAGMKHQIDLDADLTISFTDPPEACNLLVKIVQDTTPRTVTWPASVKWAGGSAPVQSTGSGAIDVYAFYHGGTDYYGQAAQDFS